MGADHGILLHTQSDINFCPSLISEWISVYASTKNYQLILTGSMSEDSMNGQVGPMIAGSLKLPAATQVICAKISEDHSRVYVEREIEKGQRELIQICLPAVLAIQTGANHPRYPSLSNLLRANKQALEKVETDSLSEATSREKFTEFIMPRKKRAARYATGSAEDKARQVLKFFRDRALI
jgi:electron transfer flavoprotein beta subunit